MQQVIRHGDFFRWRCLIHEEELDLPAAFVESEQAT